MENMYKKYFIYLLLFKQIFQAWIALLLLMPLEFGGTKIWMVLAFWTIEWVQLNAEFCKICFGMFEGTNGLYIFNY